MAFFLIASLFSLFEFSGPCGASSSLFAASAVLDCHNAAGVNPAMLSWIENPSISAGYTNLFNMKELRFTQFSCNLTSPLDMGLNVSLFGRGLYQEYIFTLSTGFDLSSTISYGIGIKGMAVRIEGYDGDFIAGLNLGLFHRGEVYNLGVALENLNSPHTEGGDEIPVKLSVGTHVNLVEALGFCADICYEKNRGSRFLGGVEFKVIQFLSLRIGMRTAPFVISSGIGLSHRRLAFDYAYRYHPHLETTHVFGLGLKM